jgi:endo-1,4-beta-xylanase
MKPINFLPEVARKVTFGAAIMLFVASSSISTGCKKEKASAPEPAGERLSGFVQDNPGGTQTDATGTNNGFFWSLYREGGSASITHGSGGNFAISYSNVTDVVGGKGWNPGSARNVGYNIGALSGSYNFVGVYGWTTSPLIEYYVAEKGGISGSTSFGTMSSDGHTYNCSKFQRVNKPSIQGTATFWQYFDNWGGTSTGSNRSINMANHINNWRSRGGQGFGSYNYMIFALEAFGNKSGYINATVW